MPNKYQKYFVQEEIGGLFFLSLPPEGCEDYYNEAVGFIHKEKRQFYYDVKGVCFFCLAKKQRTYMLREH